jgi:hypothetical protein
VSKTEPLPSNGTGAAQGNSTQRLYQPTERECALLVLRLVQAKAHESGRVVTRARLSEITLRNLWVRSRITDDFVAGVQEILIHGGWALFWVGTSYAIVKLDVIDGWPRISSKRLEAEIEEVKRGTYEKFGELEKLLVTEEDAADVDDEFDEFIKGR